MTKNISVASAVLLSLFFQSVLSTSPHRVHCVFQDSDFRIFDPRLDHEIEPTILGDIQLVQSWTWKCIEDKKFVCPQVRGRPIESLDLSQSIPKNTLIEGRDYHFNFKFIVKGEPQMEHSCWVDFYVPNVTEGEKEPFEVKLESSATPIGFFDTRMPHIFICKPVLMEDFGRDMNYSISIINEDSNAPTDVLKPSKNQITAFEDGIQIDSAFFQLNYNYSVTCEATDSGNIRYGKATRRFTTIPFQFHVNFSVEPKTGNTIDTVFTFTTEKAPDSQVNCEFGFYNDYGEVKIDSYLLEVAEYTNMEQTVYAGLPHGKYGTKMVTVFTRCFDKLG
jgi:hypothetical protein